MTELSERQKLILALVIHEYIESAQPVSSGYLVEHFQMDISSATVRNELAALTEMGYVRQPHTSAGRIPSEEGYRYFVRQLLGHTELPANTKRTISHQFYQAGQDVDRWMRLAASVLAHQSQAASLVTAPRPERPQLKHVELISTHGRQVLLVAVFAGGEIRQQMLVLAEPVQQERLSHVANQINHLAQGRGADDLTSLIGQFDALGGDIIKLLEEQMRLFSSARTGEVYRDGLTNVLAEPEFAESDAARRALRVLEERPLLEELLSRTISETGVGGVQVLIAGEGTWEELRDYSVVMARYGDPNHSTGAIGVLGPVRMAYGRTISTVRYVAGLLSDLMVEILAD